MTAETPGPACSGEAAPGPEANVWAGAADNPVVRAAAFGCAHDALAFALSAEAWPVFRAWLAVHQPATGVMGDERELHDFYALAGRRMGADMARAQEAMFG